MFDPALKIIGDADPQAFSFEWLRSMFRADHGMMESLKRGHAVLNSPEQLNQYLYTYGPMIESQWENATPYLVAGEPAVLWIDYGCGQGLAGLLVKDFAEQDPFRAVSDIVLVEPSRLALTRAEAVYRKMVPSGRIVSICKRFDAVVEADIPAAPRGTVLHLFSNSMDISGINATHLISKALRRGRHIILAVSHDRDFNGGTPQIEAVRKSFSDPSLSWLTVHRSELVRFDCTNPGRSKGVVWFSDLEVNDG